MASDNKTPATEVGNITENGHPVVENELQQIKDLSSALLRSAGEMQSAREQRSAMDVAIQELKLATQSLVQPLVDTRRIVGAEQRCECSSGPCSCVASGCCQFEIRISHIRAIEMQLEPIDSNVAPLAHMEIRIFASINGIGTVIPDMFSTMELRKNIGKPGMWHYVGRKIGMVPVQKGTPKSVSVVVDAVEVDDGGIEATGGRDEHGTNSVALDLDCCISFPLKSSLEIYLDHYGLGGGAIEVKIEAERVCC